MEPIHENFKRLRHEMEEYNKRPKRRKELRNGPRDTSFLLSLCLFLYLLAIFICVLLVICSMSYIYMLCIYTHKLYIYILNVF